MKKPTEWGIDCDVLCYAVGFACETNKDEDGNKLPSPVATTDKDTAINQMNGMLHRIMEECGASVGHLYLTDPVDNYRIYYAMKAHPYKGHRKAAKPIYYQDLWDYLVNVQGAHVATKCEADDLLAQGAYRHGHGIATIDKDLNMVAGWHYNWQKKKLYMVSPEGGMRFFYRQLITGDSADNIPGLFRLTGKKAMAKLLDPLDDFEDPRDMWEYVVDVYAEASDDIVDWNHVLTCLGTQLWMDITGDRLWHPPPSKG